MRALASLSDGSLVNSATFLRKPFAPDVLLRTVRRLLDAQTDSADRSGSIRVGVENGA